MNTIIGTSFNTHPISRELIHRHLLHPSYSFMKAMFRHQTLDGLIKHCPNKIHKAPCTICYTAKMTNIKKGTTVDIINLQTGVIIHTEFAFYNITSIHGFTSTIIVVCENTIMLWLFPTASKRAHVRIIHFILTTLMN